MSDLTVTNTPASQVTNQKQQIGNENDNGILIGASSTSKIGFFGLTTPIARRSSGAMGALANTTVTASSPYGFVNSSVLTSLCAQVEEIRATLVALGLHKGSA